MVQSPLGPLAPFECCKHGAVCTPPVDLCENVRKPSVGESLELDFPNVLDIVPSKPVPPMAQAFWLKALAQGCLGSSPRGQVGLGFPVTTLQWFPGFFFATTPQWFPETYCSWLYLDTTR